MKPNRKMHRRSLRMTLEVERLGARVVPSALSMVSSLLVNPVAYQAVRPNLPVMPFATPSKKASFIDPTVSVENGSSVVLGYQDFIGPYALLDGRGGAIKIGNASDVLDRYLHHHQDPLGEPVTGRRVHNALPGQFRYRYEYGR